MRSGHGRQLKARPWSGLGPAWSPSHLSAAPPVASTKLVRTIARTYFASFTPAILRETSATKSGMWAAHSSTGCLGGKSYSSSSKGAGLGWAFLGHFASWVVPRASASRQAHVYVGGGRHLRSPDAA